jgi:hypothetical protein
MVRVSVGKITFLLGRASFGSGMTIRFDLHWVAQQSLVVV